MKKYYIGIIVIILVTVGLLFYTISLGANNKQDKKTEKRASEIAQKLNSYISTYQKIPESLDEIKAGEVPDSIKYTKKDDTKYEFCVTFKTESSYGPDITSIFWGGALRDAQTYDDTSYNSYEDYEPSTLYISSYYHKKGKDCQTIKPIFRNTYRYDGGIAPNSSTYAAPTTSTARDTERKTDINALASHFEVYNAKNAYYPTLSNVNNSVWRTTNLKGLDTQALRDPQGTFSYLTSVPYKNLYSYKVSTDTGATCDNSVGNECTKFVLTATLEVGGTYVKNSLN